MLLFDARPQNSKHIAGRSLRYALNKAVPSMNESGLFNPSCRNHLERQVVGGSLAGRLLCCWERCCGIICNRLLRGEGTGRGRCGACDGGSGGDGLSHLATDDVEGTDVVEPTALILVRVNVELHGDIFTSLDVELLDAIFSKDAEDHAARVLSGNLNHVVLTHPRVAGTAGSAAAGGKNSNDFS